MKDNFVSFDSIQSRVGRTLSPALETVPNVIDRLYLVRDLFGRVRISVSDADAVKDDPTCQIALKNLAQALQRELGPHSYSEEEAVLFVSEELLEKLNEVAQPLAEDGPTRVYWVERLVTGSGWWSAAAHQRRDIQRFTLYSIKGGVGRSTTAAVLAWHLARNGHRVLVIDLDLESPGLSSAMLDAGHRPQFGVVDWFVEDLVGRGDRVIEAMTAAPAWAHDFEGDVRVAPAYGSEPGEYLAKLGRVYMDTNMPWTTRLSHLISQLEETHRPSRVLLESRSGLHDIAAATVTDLHAQVLLFALDSDSHWENYSILFKHWREQGVATTVRHYLSIVSALTPETHAPEYLQRFTERAWNLFRDHLYDDVPPSADSADSFSFDLLDSDAPHNPLVILWTLGLAAGASLRDFKQTVAPIRQAYEPFLARFDALSVLNDNGDTM